MNVIKNKKVVLLVGATVILVVIVFILYGVHLTGKKGRFSGASYSVNAWKFADLVLPDVLYPVVRDIDGDTIVANVGGHDVTVRLIGADTPETVDPRKPVQCYGPEASAEAKRIFGKNKVSASGGYASTTGISVYLDKDPAKGDYDKYGRLLAYVRMPGNIISADDTSASSDGDSVAPTDIYNEYMIMHGFAHEYTYLNQPYKYQIRFKSDELAAKKARRGLWGKCPDAVDD